MTEEELQEILLKAAKEVLDNDPYWPRYLGDGIYQIGPGFFTGERGMELIYRKLRESQEKMYKEE